MKKSFFCLFASVALLQSCMHPTTKEANYLPPFPMEEITRYFPYNEGDTLRFYSEYSDKYSQYVISALDTIIHPAEVTKYSKGDYVYEPEQVSLIMETNPYYLRLKLFSSRGYFSTEDSEIDNYVNFLLCIGSQYTFHMYNSLRGNTTNDFNYILRTLPDTIDLYYTESEFRDGKSNGGDGPWGKIIKDKGLVAYYTKENNQKVLWELKDFVPLQHKIMQPE